LLEESGGLEVEVAIQSDVHLTARQKRVLLDIYSTFRAENARAVSVIAADENVVPLIVTEPLKSVGADADGDGDEGSTGTRKRSARKRATAKTARAARSRVAKGTADGRQTS
jgi:hypothetical protein